MPSSSRIVFAEDLRGAAPWSPTPLGQTDRRENPQGRRATDVDPAIHYERGFQEGHAQGIADAERAFDEHRRAQLEAIAQQAASLLDAFQQQLARLQHSLADEVLALATEIARVAVGATVRLRPEATAAVAAELLAGVVAEHGRPMLRVNPEQLEPLRAALEPELEARGVQLVADAGIAPGGCVLETPSSSVDATLGTRWRRTLEAMGRSDEWIE